MGTPITQKFMLTIDFLYKYLQFTGIFRIFAAYIKESSAYE